MIVFFRVWNMVWDFWNAGNTKWCNKGVPWLGHSLLITIKNYNYARLYYANKYSKEKDGKNR